MLDKESIDALSQDELSDLHGWLADVVKYVRAKLGKDAETETMVDILPDKKDADVPADSVPDPVGDVIIAGHKKKQDRASSPRRSGWMNVAYGKEDDRHV